MEVLNFERNAVNIRIRKTLEKIRCAVGMDLFTFSELMDMPVSEYSQNLQGRGVFDVEKLVHLSKEFRISINLLFSGQVDYGALCKQFYGDSLAMPKKYDVTGHKVARARTIRNIFNTLSDSKGSDYADLLFHRLQIIPLAMTCFDDAVSGVLVMDIFKELEKWEYHDTQFIEMGYASCQINRTTQIHDILSCTDSPRSLYERVQECVMSRTSKFYDNIFLYRTEKISDEELVVTIVPNPEIYERFEMDLVGSRGLCLYKQGVYASFLAHLKHDQFRNKPRVTESACLYLGDDQCRYRIDWDY